MLSSRAFLNIPLVLEVSNIDSGRKFFALIFLVHVSARRVERAGHKRGGNVTSVQLICM